MDNYQVREYTEKTDPSRVSRALGVGLLSVLSLTPLSGCADIKINPPFETLAKAFRPDTNVNVYVNAPQEKSSGTPVEGVDYIMAWDHAAKGYKMKWLK